MWLLLVVLAAAADGAEAPGIEPGSAAAVPQARKPILGLWEARLVGAATGLALGAALAHRPDAPIPAMRPLRGTDAILTGSAVALYVGAGLFDRKPPDAAPANPANAAATRTEINGFDRSIRKAAVGHRSLEKRLLLDHISSSTLMASLFQPVGMLIAADVPHKWSRDLPVIAEATAVTLSVNAFVKHLAHRSHGLPRTSASPSTPWFRARPTPVSPSIRDIRVARSPPRSQRAPSPT